MIKNTKDQLNESQKWAMVDRRSPGDIFRSWGAAEWYEIPDPAYGVQAFMIRLDDGLWYYSHISLSGHARSAYCPTTGGIKAESGTIAWLLMRRGEAIRRLGDVVTENQRIVKVIKGYDERLTEEGHLEKPGTEVSDAL